MSPSHPPNADDALPPFIDEHQVRVSAHAPEVWRALTRQVAAGPGFGTTGAFAHLVAAEPRRAVGRLFDEGATLPGFAVTKAVPGHLVELTGRHRFSRYALVFTLTAQGDGTLLSARSHAAFPGVLGWVYRQLVIGSGTHGVLVRRRLRHVRSRAEHPGP